MKRNTPLPALVCSICAESFIPKQTPRLLITACSKTKCQNKRWLIIHAEERKLKDAARRQNPKNKEMHAKASAKWRENNPEKVAKQTLRAKGRRVALFQKRWADFSQNKRRINPKVVAMLKRGKEPSLIAVVLGIPMSQVMKHVERKD